MGLERGLGASVPRCLGATGLGYQTLGSAAQAWIAS